MIARGRRSAQPLQVTLTAERCPSSASRTRSVQRMLHGLWADRAPGIRAGRGRRGCRPSPAWPCTDRMASPGWWADAAVMARFTFIDEDMVAHRRGIVDGSVTAYH